MRRMRVAAGVLEAIKQEDPDTAITLTNIRNIIASGKVPVVVIGRKRLVDADLVIQYIDEGWHGEAGPPREEEPLAGGARGVASRVRPVSIGQAHSA